jgi:two-component system, NtrC family, nitrogen regulation sensor histidine kinase NtrY
MVNLHFYVNVVVRVLLLTANCMIFAFTWYGSGNYFSLVNLSLLIVLQAILFIYYVNKTNRDLAGFFDSIKNEDSGLSFNRSKRKFRNIYKSMDDVNTLIKSIRIKYAIQDQYFKTIVESIQTGLISFGPDGKVDIINKAAKNLLGIKTIHKIDKLNNHQKGLGDILHAIRPSEKRLIQVNTGNDTVSLSLNSTVLKLVDRELKIITFQDIRHELDRKELESWQKLIRILNHEIMNSLAPIISTTATLSSYFSGKDTGDSAISSQQWDRMREKAISGLSIIHERSEGLKSFVEHYKAFNALPQPVMSTFAIRELLTNCEILLGEELQTNRINCISEITRKDIELTADKSQIQQILINLVKNSMESLSATEKINKVIKLKVFHSENGKVIIQVSDNGKGIPPELIDQIFIPFFTTKEKGSGIGLSLSRQIMHLHNGTISVYSIPEKETVFTMVF